MFDYEEALFKLDANESAFLRRQTEHIKSKSYDVKHKLLKAATLIPVSTEAPSGAEFITYTVFDMIGQSTIISDYANDFKRVDVTGSEVQGKVKSTGNSYGYSVQELRTSQMANANLDTKRATASRKSSDQLTNSIAWSGDTDHNLKGLIAFPGITEYTVPTDGTGTSATWATKTPDQIVRDVMGMVNAIMVPTNGVEQPDTLILPLTQHNDIAGHRMTGGDSTTVLSYILKNNPFINRIDWVDELSGAGASSTDRMMMYSMDDDTLTLEIPQPYEVFGPQQEAMEFIFTAHARTAGVFVYYPAAVVFGDGI